MRRWEFCTGPGTLVLSLTTIKARAGRGDFDGNRRSTARTIMNTLAEGNLRITRGLCWGKNVSLVVYNGKERSGS